MARILTLTWESNQSGSNSTEGITTATGVTINTNTDFVRTGTASAKVSWADYANARLGSILFSSSTSDALMRIPVYVTALPEGNMDIASFSDGAGDAISLKVTAAGLLRLDSGATWNVSTTGAVTVGAWNDIQIRLRRSTSDSLHEIVLNGETVTDTTNDTSTSNINGIKLGHGGGGILANTIYFDDVAVNNLSGGSENTYPDKDGKCDILLPVSDNSIGDWTAGAGATSNLFDALDNTPPLGVATGSETNTTNVRYVTGASADLDINVETYSSIGIASIDTIKFVEALVRHGEVSGSLTKGGTLTTVSDPAQGSSDTFNYGNDLGTHEDEIGSWRTKRGAIQYSPSVTIGNNPVLRVGVSSGNDVDVDFLGLLVEWVPWSAAGETQQMLIGSYAKLNSYKH